MRIQCATVDEFLTCLDAEQQIFQGVIRVNVSKVRYSDGSPCSIVTFQASCIVLVVGGGEYLLDVGEICGKDYADADPSTEGSQAAEVLRAGLSQYAEARGWKLLPGVIHL